MSAPDIERQFVDACIQDGIAVSVQRTTAIDGDWQIDFTAGNRKFTVESERRDGFVFLERIDGNANEFVLFDQGQATQLWLDNKAACTRAAALLKMALRDPDFRGCPSRVI